MPSVSRRRVHDILEHGVEGDPVSAVVNTGLIVLILLNVVAFAAETVPEIGARYAGAFRLFNLFSVAVFTLEYGLRLWSCVEIPMLRQFSPARARLHFAVRPLLIVDLLAILPFYLSFLIAIDLRVLRVLRLFRFLKLARYSPALHTLGRVLVNERRALLGALLVMASLILFGDRHLSPGTRCAARGLRQRARRRLVGAGDAYHGRLWRRGAGHGLRQDLRRARHGVRPRHVRPPHRHRRDGLQPGGEPA